MTTRRDALVILTPAFSVDDADQWLPFQESFIRSLNAAFPRLHVVVVAFHFPGTAARYLRQGYEVIALGGRMRGGLRSPGRWLRAWMALGQVRKRYRIAGLLSMFCSESAFIGQYFSRAYGIPHRIWVLGQDARKANAQVARIRPREEQLVTISDALVREFEASHGIRPAQVVPIGIRPEDFAPPSEARDIHLLGAGTLSPIKRYDIFIEVAAQLRRELPDLRAVICGGGSELASLQARIDRAGLAQNIRIRTGMNRAEVLKLMQRSWLLLHPSSYEGFGMVCTEALYAGAEVISFVRPMDAPIPGWHIAGDTEAMCVIASACLRTAAPDFNPKLPFAMADTARSIMRLFNYPDQPEGKP